MHTFRQLVPLLFLLLILLIGTAAVIRSYASAATTESERAGVFGVISAAQAIGFIFGPGLKLYFMPIMHFKTSSWSCLCPSWW